MGVLRAAIEQLLAKVRVAGSNLVVRSRESPGQRPYPGRCVHARARSLYYRERRRRRNQGGNDHDAFASPSQAADLVLVRPKAFITTILLDRGGLAPDLPWTRP